MTFTNAQRATLALVCETFIPLLTAENEEAPRLFALSASDLNLAAEVERAIMELTSPADQQQLGVFLRIIESATFNRLTTGQPGAFSQLTLGQRTALLRAWGDSNYSLARQAFQGLKRLVLALFYATLPTTHPEIAREGMGYAIPAMPAPDSQRPIKPLEITAPQTLYADVIVIGSGAGGGVIAGELSAAGLDVLIVEKGGYYATPDYHGQERLASEQMYEKRSILTTADNSIALLAGSTLGGGTVINWMTSLEPPAHVREEWAHTYGFTAATSADFQTSLEAVSQRININTAESPANPLNAALEIGCQRLGYSVETIPRNVRDCADCGYCGYGCRFNGKQSTLLTYLEDAVQQGARVLVNAHVDRIQVEHGIATGAEATVHTATGQHPVTIKAKVVVAAAGAIHTPALLRRSGLGNAHIGANLHLHPTSLIASRFHERIEGWHGAPQTRVSRHFANLDGRGYGVWMETAPVHPGLGAQTFRWESGRMHKRTMQQIGHFANIIVLTRDRYSGRVTTDRNGQPVLHYRLHPQDAAHLQRGLLEAIRIHHAAGAQEIYSPHQALAAYQYDADLDAFLLQVAHAGLQRNAFGLFSAHQMCTCRIGGSSAIGALTPAGESYEVRNLFVTDGSTLPNAPGVNPMVSIMGLAHYIAQGIKTLF